MKWFQDFSTQRLIPQSFAWKIEWSIRTVFPFIVSAIFCIYFDEYLIVPFLLPIIVLVVANDSIGKTLFVFTSANKGGFFVSVICSIFYWIPFYSIHWIFCLIYFFFTSLLFSILLHKNPVSLKIGLALHVINTLQFKTVKNMKFYDIWWLYSVLPIVLIICLISIYFPFFNYNYSLKHCLYCEHQSIKLCQMWLKECFQFFLNCNCSNDNNNTDNSKSTNKINYKENSSMLDSCHRIQRAKLKKYLILSNKNKSHIYQTSVIARGM